MPQQTARGRIADKDIATSDPGKTTCKSQGRIYTHQEMDSTHCSYVEPEQNQADLYYKVSVDLQTRDGVKLINKVSLAEGSTVLDVGCGTGNLATVLAEKTGPKGHVTGVDPDRERINVAKAKNSKPNITFLEANGETFPQDQYDLVFSNYVLHWIKDKKAVFERVSENLLPGGQFAFTLCQAMPPLYEELLNTMGLEQQTAFKQRVSFVSFSELEELATTCGFTVTYKELGVSRLPLPSIDSAIDFLYASATGHVDPAQANQERLTQLKEKYANRPVEFAEEYASLVLVKD